MIPFPLVKRLADQVANLHAYARDGVRLATANLKHAEEELHFALNARELVNALHEHNNHPNLEIDASCNSSED